MHNIYKKRVAQLVLALGIMGFVFVAHTPHAHAAAGACVDPGTYGTVSFLKTDNKAVTITPGTYRVFVRMAVPNATDTSFKLDIDGANCYTMGSNNITPSSDLLQNPLPATPTINWTWVDYEGATATAKVNVTIAQIGGADAHEIKLIGNAANVAIDRILFIPLDANNGNQPSCTPSGPTDMGDTCAASSVNNPPTVGVSASPTTGSAPLSTTLTATPADSDGSISSVEFFNGTTSLGTPKTAAPWTWTVTGLAAGTYNFKARAKDNSGATTDSAPVTVTVTTPSTCTSPPGPLGYNTLIAVLNNYGTTSLTKNQIDLTKGELDCDGAVGYTDLIWELNHY